MDKTCVNCGSRLVNRGPAAKQCGECERGRRRIKERSATCIDCGCVFKPPGQTGQAPLRCETCNTTSERARNSARQKKWRDANPDRNKEQQNRHNRKRLADPTFVAARRIRRRELQYGLTQEQFDAILVEQGHLCAICRNGHVGVGDDLHIDHNHETGKVRALLCGKCNTLIGLADDSPERLDLAAAYLRRHA